MRILFLTNFYPPHELGGYGQWCQEVAVGLVNLGHEIKILTSRYGVSSETTSDNNDIIRSLHLESDIDYYRPIDFFLRRPAREQANLVQLRKCIGQFKPDALMVWGMWQLSFNLPYWAEHLLPGRVTYYIASYWPTDPDPHAYFWQLPANRATTELAKRPLRALALSKLRREKYPPRLHFEHTACCSKYVRDRLVNAGKLPRNAAVLYGGIDPTPFLSETAPRKNQNKETLELLYFGRLISDKGVHTAIEAVGILKKQGVADAIKLTILGNGHPAYEQELREMVHRLDIANQVHFAGRISRDEIPRTLQNFDVFLFTSIWPEPFGRTIIEAMAAGLVVIGSDVGGSREIFQYYDQDLLFQPENSQELADRIVRVMNNPDLRKHLIQLGQRLGREQFTMDGMVSNIEAHLTQIVSRADYSFIK